MSQLVLLSILSAAALVAAEPGFTPLFDGKTLTGWTLFNKKEGGAGYVVENGTIACPPDGGGNLLTDREFSNFILRFEFKLEPGGNNGIGIRAPLAGDIAYSGMEIQILDHQHPKYATWLKPVQQHGAVYDVFAPTGDNPLTGEHWNTEEIIADGPRIRVTLNGKVILEANLDTVTDPEVLKKHPGLKRKSGRIGFLGHGSRVAFRNIRIKELP